MAVMFHTLCSYHIILMPNTVINNSISELMICISDASQHRFIPIVFDHMDDYALITIDIFMNLSTDIEIS